MSQHRFGAGVGTCLASTEGYAFFEDACDATRYAQRVAVLRQARYHGQLADLAEVACQDSPRWPVGERF